MEKLAIKSSHNSHFRNSEHFQFITEVRDLIQKYGADKLAIEELAAEFALCFKNEDEAIKKIVKSAITADIEAADQTRDITFRGLADTVKTALKHFDPTVAAAARRLQVVFDTYGNLAQKPLNEETADIYNLLQEINGKYAADKLAAGIDKWALKLEADNKAFDELVKARNADTASITQLNAKQCRAETDRVYYEIVERINALIIVNGEKSYADFVNRLNAFIDKYNNTIAQRAGQKKSEEENE